MTVPETILHQIKAQDPRALWAWGARDLVGDKNKKLGALTFTVANNPKVKQTARVEIVLDYDDTYTVSVYKIRKCQRRDVKVVEGVYFDQLIEIIDDILG